MRDTTRWGALVLSGLAIAGAGFGSAAAQSYPSKPVRVIVGYPPGAGNDVIARLVLGEVSKNIGQQLVIDNRPGASGNIGAEMAARSAPDGYTLLNAPGSITATRSLARNLGYDLLEDLRPIALMASVPFVLGVHPSLPVKTARDLVAFAKQRPGELTFASSGTGGLPHLTAELFAGKAGLKLLHVAYRGTGQANLDVVNGQVTMVFAPTASIVPHVRSKRVRPLAITTSERHAALPGVPTLSEAALPGFESRNWVGLFAPAGAPAEVGDRLNPEINRVVDSPAMRERFAQLVIEPMTGTQAHWAKYVRDEVAKWEAVVRSAGIRIE